MVGLGAEGLDLGRWAWAWVCEWVCRERRFDEDVDCDNVDCEAVGADVVVGAGNMLSGAVDSTLITSSAKSSNPGTD